MTHNPIVEQKPISRNPLAGRVDIPLGMIGLLYGGGRFVRRLQPGDNLSFSERQLSGAALYVVDVRQRTIDLSFTPLDRSTKHSIPLRVSVEYRVDQAERMVEQRVADTEELIRGLLKPIIAREARQLLIHEHDQLAQRVQDLIEPASFAGLGLQLIKGDVEVRTEDPEFQRQLRDMDNLLRTRALKLPLQLPDRTGKHRFPVTLFIDVRAKSADLALSTEESEEERIRRILEQPLRRESRQLLLHQYDELLLRLEDAVSPALFDGVGLSLVNCKFDFQQDDRDFQTQVERFTRLSGPTAVALSFDLLTKGGKDRFPLRVKLTYQATNLERLLDLSTDELNAQIARAVEPLVRREARQFVIEQHADFTERVEEVLWSVPLHDLGLKLLQPDAEIISDDTVFQQRLSQIQALERMTRTPQYQLFETLLPSKVPTVEFVGRADVTYRLINPAQLPTETPAEAITQIWPRIQQVLRRISRRYELGEEWEAEDAINSALADYHVTEYGLEITSVNAAIMPDARVLEQRYAILGLNHEIELQRLRDEQARLIQEAHLIREGNAQNYYAAIVEKGDFSLMAMLLAQNPGDVRDVLGMLTDRQQQELELKMELIKQLSAKGEFMEQAKTSMFREVVQNIIGVRRELGAASTNLLTDTPTERTAAERRRMLDDEDARRGDSWDDEDDEPVTGGSTSIVEPVADEDNAQAEVAADPGPAASNESDTEPSVDLEPPVDAPDGEDSATQAEPELAAEPDADTESTEPR